MIFVHLFELGFRIAATARALEEEASRGGQDPINMRWLVAMPCEALADLRYFIFCM